MTAGRGHLRADVQSIDHTAWPEAEQRAYERGIELDFGRHGKELDDAHVESLNGAAGPRCPNPRLFLPLEHAKVKIAAWRTGNKREWR